MPRNGSSNTAAEAMIEAIKGLPEHLRRSLTWDRAGQVHQDIQLALELPVYFCKPPHSPWQRGTNENTDRLLPHWFTKGTDLSV